MRAAIDFEEDDSSFDDGAINLNNNAHVGGLLVRIFAFTITSTCLYICLGFLLVPGAAVLAASANSSAPKGGTLVRNLKGEPPSLHPVMANDLYASYVQDYVMDTLAERDPESGEFRPRLAEKWEIAKDGRTMTFFLRKDVTFHDGKPFTAEDVKFSFEAVSEKAYNAAHLISYIEGIEKIEVVDPLTVKFILKNTYFQNFYIIANFHIFPKSVYGDTQKSMKLTRDLVGSGPYRLEKFDRGSRIVLKRNESWFGFKNSDWKGYQNFDSVILRFIKDDATALEQLKKGDLDFLYPLNVETYEAKGNAEVWGKSVSRHKIENLSPKNSSFVGWNLRKNLFGDKNVRLALAHLMNREEMNKKFRHGSSFLASGPVHIQSDYAPSDVEPIAFNAKKAHGLLTKAGWVDSNKDGILDKEIDGKRVDFRFTLLHSNREFEKYLAMYREELSKAGIDVDVRYMEWNMFLKMLDEANFDAAVLSWSGTPDWDPKPIWHSSSAVAGGLNFIGYKNTEVDKFIDSARYELERRQRVKTLRKVYEIIASEAPYLFLFDDRYEYYAISNKVQKPADTFKYEIGHEYWWVKPTKEK